MKHTNIEIKARSSEEQQEKIRRILKENCAEYFGTDNQVDTYFKVEPGRRLKIRKGDIENYVIDYKRKDEKEPKKSEVILQPLLKSSYDFERIIRQTHEVLIEVRKKREIYFINNVKFHIDDVLDLGKFIEVEAISKESCITLEKLGEQCNYYLKLLGIKNEDLINGAYSDILLTARSQIN